MSTDFKVLGRWLLLTFPLSSDAGKNHDPAYKSLRKPLAFRSLAESGALGNCDNKTGLGTCGASLL